MNSVLEKKKLNIVKKKYGKNSCIFKIKSPNKNKVYIGYSGYGFEFIKEIYIEMHKSYKKGIYKQRKSYYDLLDDKDTKFYIIEEEIIVIDQQELRNICSVYMYDYFLKDKLYNEKIWGITKKEIKCHHCQKTLSKKLYRDHNENDVKCLKKKAIYIRNEYIQYEKYLKEFWNYKIFYEYGKGKTPKLYFNKEPETEKFIKNIRSINNIKTVKVKEDIVMLIRAHLSNTLTSFYLYRDKYRKKKEFI